MRCARCGSEISDDSRFCCKCGYDVSVKKCPKCGSTLAPDSVFCSACGQKVGNFDSNENAPFQGGEYRAAYRAVKKEKKDLSGLLKRIALLTKVWLIVAVFALMFGLSFLPIGTIDGSDIEQILDDDITRFEIDGNTYTIKIRYTTIDAIAALFSKKDFEEFLSEYEDKLVPVIEEFLDGELSQESLNKIFNSVNWLKLMSCSQFREAQPFSTIFTLCSIMICGLLMMVSSLVFFILSLIRAIKITMGIPQGEVKDRTNLGLAIIAAVTVFTFIIGGIMVGCTLALFLISLLGFAINYTLERVFIAAPAMSLRKLITAGSSLAIVFILMFTAGANAVKGNFTYKHFGVLSGTNNVKTKTQTNKFHFEEALAMLDLYSMDEDSVIYLFGQEISLYIGDTNLKSKMRIYKIASFLKNSGGAYYSYNQLVLLNEDATYNLGLGDFTEDEYNDAYSLANSGPLNVLKAIEPYSAGFYAETAEFRVFSLIVAILTLIVYLGYASILALLFSFILNYISSGGKKSLMPLFIVNLVVFCAALAVDIMFIAGTNSIFSQLNTNYYKVSLAAAPIFNIIFALALLVGNIVINMLDKKKENQKLYAPPYSNAGSNLPTASEHVESAAPVSEPVESAAPVAEAAPTEAPVEMQAENV